MSSSSSFILCFLSSPRHLFFSPVRLYIHPWSDSSCSVSFWDFKGVESERRTEFQFRLPSEELVWPTSILWRSLSLITSTYTGALILFFRCSVAKHSTQPETHCRRFLNVSKNLICPLMHLLHSDRPGSAAVVAMPVLFFCFLSSNFYCEVSDFNQAY